MEQPLQTRLPLPLIMGVTSILGIASHMQDHISSYPGPPTMDSQSLFVSSTLNDQSKRSPLNVAS